jgi:hypothetical protein
MRCPVDVQSALSALDEAFADVFELDEPTQLHQIFF